MKHCAVALLLLSATQLRAADADLILHNGKVVTVDQPFRIHQAIAVEGERILKVGSNDDVLKTEGGRRPRSSTSPARLVLPGLIDSHVHSDVGRMTEFDHPIPDMESIADVLDYVQCPRQGRCRKATGSPCGRSSSPG